ncbi:MAG: histidine phosphatase family protein, partial [Bacillota bacterium]
TEWSKASRLQGSRDVPLCDAGRRDARMVASRLVTSKVERLLTSPLKRARETAEIIGSVIGVRVEVAPELCEMSFGAFEGKSHDEIEAISPGFKKEWMTSPTTVVFPGGESLAELEARCVGFIKKVACEAEHAKAIAFVSHGQVIRTLLCWALGLGQNARNRFTVQCGSISVLEMDGAHVKLISLNETGHLIRK